MTKKGESPDSWGEKIALLIDFDGTAALDNVGMALIESFARDDSWRVIDEDYLTGRIGSRRAYQLLSKVMTGDPDKWRSFALEHHRLDPGLTPLIGGALEQGWLVEILSDGFTTYISALLEREGIDVPVKASVVPPPETDEQARFTSPHINPECGRCGTCKHVRVVELHQRGYFVIFIGDGLSDKCGSRMADRIFAKDLLAEHLEEIGVGFEHFSTLDDVLRALFSAQPDYMKG